jgi:hypothetical protein
MNHIKLIKNTDTISNHGLTDLFNHKAQHLADNLAYLDRVGIDATIIFEGKASTNGLVTTLTVECADENFKHVIEECIKPFIYTHLVMKARKGRIVLK